MALVSSADISVLPSSLCISCTAPLSSISCLISCASISKFRCSALTSVEDRRYYLEVEQLLTFLPITDSAPEKDTKQKTQDDEDRN